MQYISYAVTKSFRKSITFPLKEVDFLSVIPHFECIYLNKFSLLFIRREHKKTINYNKIKIKKIIFLLF